MIKTPNLFLYRNSMEIVMACNGHDRDANLGLDLVNWCNIHI